MIAPFDPCAAGKLGGADVFALNTFFAFVIMAPVAFVMEGAIIKDGKACSSWSHLVHHIDANR